MPRTIQSYKQLGDELRLSISVVMIHQLLSRERSRSSGYTLYFERAYHSWCGSSSALLLSITDDPLRNCFLPVIPHTAIVVVANDSASKMPLYVKAK